MHVHLHLVIQVFRMIDRADYMIFTDEEDDRLEAYEDHAWRRGTLHLSAPCIYTRALEALKLDKGILHLLCIILYIYIRDLYLIQGGTMNPS